MVSAASAPLPSSLPPHAPQLMANHPPWPATHYTVLDLSPQCQQYEIKQRFWELSMKHHPDAGGKYEDWIPVRNAYSLLKDEAQRKDYDRYLAHLAAAFPQPLPTPPLSPAHTPESPRQTPLLPRIRYVQLPTNGSVPRLSTTHLPRIVVDVPESPSPQPGDAPRPYEVPRSPPPQPDPAPPPPSSPDRNYKYLFDDEAGRIRRWVEKVVENNDRRAKKYDGWRQHRREEARQCRESRQRQADRRGERRSVRAASGQLVRETAARTRASARKVGDWTLRRRLEGPGASSQVRGSGSQSQSWRTAQGQSAAEPTWTDLMNRANTPSTSSYPSSLSSSSSTSLPSGSSSSFLAPPSLDDGWTLTPSMSPSQGGLLQHPEHLAFAVPPLRPRPPGSHARSPSGKRLRSPSPYPTPPQSASESISAVRETLRQCGDTPITRMIAVELDKLEQTQGCASHLQARVQAGGGNKFRIFVVILRTLLAEGTRRRWRQIKGWAVRGRKRREREERR